MNKILFVLLLGAFAFVGCGDEDCSEDEVFISTIDRCIPKCIDDLAVSIQQDPLLCTDANDADLTIWEFNGREVYCFFYGSCSTDSKAVIYEADCSEVCTLFGVSGNTQCEGITWDGNASRVGTIYTF